MSERPEACLNCATPLDGVWCSRCGQANRHARMRPDDLAHDVVDEIFGIDTRIGRTLIDFTRRPGRAALAYVQGHRARYLNPLKYMLFAVALYFLLLKGFGIQVSDLSPQVGRPAAGDPVANELSAAILDIVNEGLRIILFAAPPVFAWVTNAFLGRRHFRLGKHGGLTAWMKDLISAPTAFNFAEGCSLWLHVFAQVIVLITLPAIVLTAGGFDHAIYWAGIPTLGFYAWAAKDFYGRGWFYSVFIVLVAYVGFQLVFILSLLLSVAIAVAVSS
jgi:hypothetical protein